MQKDEVNLWRIFLQMDGRMHYYRKNGGKRMDGWMKKERLVKKNGWKMID